jgi:hypothetical protein
MLDMELRLLGWRVPPASDLRVVARRPAVGNGGQCTTAETVEPGISAMYNL